MQEENNQDSPKNVTKETNEKAVKEMSEALSETVKNKVDDAADSLEEVVGFDTDFLKDIASKNNIGNLTLPVLKIVKNTVDKQSNGKPIVEISTIWTILQVVMEIISSFKQEKKIPGSRCKQLALQVLRVLVEDFAEGNDKVECMALLKSSIPAAIDLIVGASKGKVKLNSKLLDFNGDDVLDMRDLSFCSKFMTRLCCFSSCCKKK
tara:strand:- start:5178 stop:5798 length:621 start_codon:yes stop_codon:yes gene_type:complete